MTIKEKCASTKEKVALAMAEVLEEEDWNVFQYKVVCSKCKKSYYNSEYFCSKCGNELDKTKGKLEPHVVELLWKAFEEGCLQLKGFTLAREEDIIKKAKSYEKE